MSLKKVIEGFLEELEEKAAIREEILFSSRKIIRLSKQAIMAIHRGELAEAKGKLGETEKILRKAEARLGSHPELMTGSMKIAYQEYSEAQIFLIVIEENEFPTPKILGIPVAPYLLGLADSIGEFRRRAVDSLRKRKLGRAEECLKIMDDIYMELIALEDAYSIVPELRRKCDIARRLIEITLGEIVNEKRRSSLEKSIRLLERRMGAVEA